MTTVTLWVATLGALVSLPMVAGAAPCSDLPNPVYLQVGEYPFTGRGLMTIHDHTLRGIDTEIAA